MLALGESSEIEDKITDSDARARLWVRVGGEDAVGQVLDGERVVGWVLNERHDGLEDEEEVMLSVRLTYKRVKKVGVSL